MVSESAGHAGSGGIRYGTVRREIHTRDTVPNNQRLDIDIVMRGVSPHSVNTVVMRQRQRGGSEIITCPTCCYEELRLPLHPRRLK